MSTVEQLNLDALVGRPVAEARSAVAEAGGTLRTVSADQAMTAEFRPQRVTLLVADGRVVGNLGIG